LPKAKIEKVTEGGQPLQSSKGISATRQVGDAVTADLGSGNYLFEYGN
jgi:hypothetical protein